MKRILIFLVLCLTACIQIHAQHYVPTYFSKADFIEDLQYLSQKVTRVHIKLLSPAESASWKTMIDSVAKNLPDSISYNDAYIKVSSALATLHDSHSDFSIAGTERKKYMQNGGVTMPFTVKIVNGKLCINQYFGENSPGMYGGAEILAINSVSSNEILSKMRGLSASVSTYGIEHYYGPYFWMFFGAQPEYKVSLDQNGSTFSIVTKGVSNADFLAQKNKYYPEKKSRNCELTLCSNATAIIKFEKFSDDLVPFFRSAFDTIEHHKCKNLVIDIRNNPGGMGVYVDSLMNYLTKKTYSQYSYSALRISDEVKEHYQKKKPDFFQTIALMPIDTICKWNNTELTRIPVSERVLFKGNIFVLTNGNTSSAASTLAGIIKGYKMGRIFGQPTGGTIHYYANAITFKLPHLGEEFTVSPTEFVQHGGDIPGLGVIPDVLLEEVDYTAEEIARKIVH